MIGRAGGGAALAVAAAALGGCGGAGEERGGDLAWLRTPSVFRQATDRVVQGTVRNTSPRRLEIRAADLRLVDSRGRRVLGVATFSPGYQHGLFPPSRVPERARAAEDRRLGRTVEIEPGKTALLTLAWRDATGPRAPVRVAYRESELPLPPAG